MVQHPYLYQLQHPWHWLTYGQNATALGIILGSVLSVLTVWVLAKTLVAVNAQALAARMQADAAIEQVAAAKSSTSVSDAQRIATEESALAERAHNALIRVQLLNEMRPVLVVGKRPHPTMSGTLQNIVSNHGQGVALDIVFNYRDTTRDAISLNQNILGPSESVVLHMDLQRVALAGLQARYLSQDGRYFATTALLVNQEFVSSAFEVNEKGGWLETPKIPLDEES
ncbi:hypothetical protein [Granulicella mallensis]|uniref:Uncharacterized protein n=1 Tax=Granulicella mallensis TaxID=940614 RepID=A0A7W7ZUM6_9BACT|nr:hypothetical protein [Granulicella mallensis]MBB5066014.1 hypothetical protein [Granulicella mallensis]